jgi:hypothetical protein
MILPGAHDEPAGNPRFGAAGNEVGHGDFAKKFSTRLQHRNTRRDGAPGIVIAAIMVFA